MIFVTMVGQRVFHSNDNRKWLDINILLFFEVIQCPLSPKKISTHHHPCSNEETETTSTTSFASAALVNSSIQAYPLVNELFQQGDRPTTRIHTWYSTYETYYVPFQPDADELQAEQFILLTI